MNQKEKQQILLNRLFVQYESKRYLGKGHLEWDDLELTLLFITYIKSLKCEQIHCFIFLYYLYSQYAGYMEPWLTDQFLEKNVMLLHEIYWISLMLTSIELFGDWPTFCQVIFESSENKKPFKGWENHYHQILSNNLNSCKKFIFSNINPI